MHDLLFVDKSKSGMNSRETKMKTLKKDLNKVKKGCGLYNYPYYPNTALF
jgi:hypothetical protein